MTQMTSPETTQQIVASARTTIAQGGTYEHRGADGSVARIFYVAGGSFCRVELRSAAGVLDPRSRAYQFTTHALTAFGEIVDAMTEETNEDMTTKETEAFERMIAEEYEAEAALDGAEDDEDDAAGTLPATAYIQGWLDGKGAVLSQHESDQLRAWLGLALDEIVTLRKAMAEQPVPQVRRNDAEALSVREVEIYRYLRNTNMTVGEIAGTLFVSQNTVKTHCKNIYRKMGVARRGELRECPNH